MVFASPSWTSNRFVLYDYLPNFRRVEITLFLKIQKVFLFTLIHCMQYREKYKTLDNVIFSIYTVVDNFSRKIVAWDISTKKCCKIRTETVERAIKNEFDVTIDNQSLDLIVDGGTELLMAEQKTTI